MDLLLAAFLWNFTLSLLAAAGGVLLAFVIPNPADLEIPAANIVTSEEVGQLRVNVPIRPPANRWRALLAPLTLMVVVTVRVAVAYDTVGMLLSVLPYAAVLFTVGGFLYIWKRTAKEELVANQQFVSVCYRWRENSSLLRRDIAVSSIEAVRYELEAGLYLLTSPRTLVIQHSGGKRQRFGGGLGRKQALATMEAILRATTTEVPSVV